jgi:hypothetical protein
MPFTTLRKNNQPIHIHPEDGNYNVCQNVETTLNVQCTYTKESKLYNELPPPKKTYEQRELNPHHTTLPTEHSNLHTPCPLILPFSQQITYRNGWMYYRPFNGNVSTARDISDNIRG